MRVLKLLYCKSKMIAFIHGELSPDARRRVVRYIDEYPDCYDEYIRQRALSRELDGQLQRIGNPDSARLDALWGAIQQELARGSLNSHMGQCRFSVRYTAIAVIVFVLLAVLPLIGSQRVAEPIVPSHPAPQELNVAVTPANRPAGAHTEAAIFVVTKSRTAPMRLSALLQNTPEPSS